VIHSLFSFASLMMVLGVASLLPGLAQAEVVRHELVIRNEKVNLSGKREVDFALTVNGGIPAPTLEFTEGDDAEIWVKNELPGEEVSIHWHGLLLPPEEDGVPYVNTPPIFPGESRTFRFKVRQSGTYWYHSHTAVQEQKGVYGAFIIHPKKKPFAYDRDVVVVISDWSDENADRIIQNLRKDGDYYLYKKDTVRSYLGALKAGGLGSQLYNESTRMGGMDLSDVGYDAFLINGKRELQLAKPKPGERVRLRIINAGASSYFYVSMGAPMLVVSADGVDVAPVRAERILMGMAETYDILFTMPEQKNYELRATVQDVTGFASAWIGDGEKVPAPAEPFPDLYATMEHAEHAAHSGHDTHSKHDSHASHDAHAQPIELLTVDALRAIVPTTFPRDAKVHDVRLTLGGDMERYIWHLNGKTIHEDRLLRINRGEVVRFTFENQTMMHHPMHLHGHFFRVVNEGGERSPLKHTVDVPPHSSRTIEFYANEPGQWMLHCHNLYHMKTGMARVVRYNDFKLTPDMEKYDPRDPHLHDHLYTASQLEAASNHARASFRLMRTWDELDLEVETADVEGRNFTLGNAWETEGDLRYRRWFSNFFHLLGNVSLYDERIYGMVGLGYILPMLIETSLSISHEGLPRLDVERRLQWTSSIFTDVELTWRPAWDGERDFEYEISLMYGPSWHWAAGLMWTERSLGVGAQVRF
jgi:FtsP/CotA-like multicopper oxidase with cupredoxin domain